LTIAIDNQDEEATVEASRAVDELHLQALEAVNNFAHVHQELDLQWVTHIYQGEEIDRSVDETALLGTIVRVLEVQLEEGQGLLLVGGGPETDPPEDTLLQDDFPKKTTIDLCGIGRHLEGARGLRYEMTEQEGIRREVQGLDLH
jgi:hypothetical protein